MKFMKVTSGKKVLFAAANYEPRSIVYDKMQSIFLKGLDGVITYSKAYSKILANLKIPSAKF